MHTLHDLSHGAPGNDSCLAPLLQSLGRYPGLCKGNLPLNLGVRALQLLVQVHGDLFDLSTLSLYAEPLCHIQKLLLVFDLIVLDLALYHPAKHIQHGHAVVGVSRRTSGNHPSKVPRGNDVDARTANTNLTIGILARETTRTHGAVLATGRVRPNGTGLHVHRPVHGGLYAIFRCLAQHLLG